MKSTPLLEKHLALGAKMAAFAGYNMPISYAGIKEEHHAVRNGVGIFDVSHMGEFVVKGERATDFLQFVTSNDVSKLTDGQVQYSCFPNHEGGIVDDLLVYRWNKNEYYLVVNASNIDKDWSWLVQHQVKFGIELQNISDNLALLAIQGPKATEILQTLTDVPLSDIAYYHFKSGTMAGIEDVIISATGYTGAGGFELYVWNKDAAKMWDAVMEAGKTLGIQAAGLGARDTLRLEMGYCLYGNDIDDLTSPMEAGLGWITKLAKGDFNSSDIFKQQKEAGVTRKLIGFEMLDRRVPRHDYQIADAESNLIGKVTSGTQSPTLDKPIGMGYVNTNFAHEGAEIFIAISGKLLAAKVVKLPFLKK